MMNVGEEFITDEHKDHQKDERLVKLTKIQEIHLGKGSDGLQGTDTKRGVCFSIIQRIRTGIETLDFETRNAKERTQLILKIMDRIKPLGLNTKKGHIATKLDIQKHEGTNRILKIQFERWMSKTNETIGIHRDKINFVDVDRDVVTKKITFELLTNIRVYHDGEQHHLSFTAADGSHHQFASGAEEGWETIPMKVVHEMEKYGKTPRNSDIDLLTQQIRDMQPGDALDIEYGAARGRVTAQYEEMVLDSGDTKWKMYQHRNGKKKKMVMIVGSEMITDDKHSQIGTVNLKEIHGIYLGKISEGLKDVDSPHDLCFSITQNTETGWKTLDFEMRNKRDRIAIVSDIMDKMDRLGIRPENGIIGVDNMKRNETLKIKFYHEEDVRISGIPKLDSIQEDTFSITGDDESEATRSRVSFQNEKRMERIHETDEYAKNMDDPFSRVATRVEGTEHQSDLIRFSAPLPSHKQLQTNDKKPRSLSLRRSLLEAELAANHKKELRKIRSKSFDAALATAELEIKTELARLSEQKQRGPANMMMDNMDSPDYSTDSDIHKGLTGERSKSKKKYWEMYQLKKGRKRKIKMNVCMAFITNKRKNEELVKLSKIEIIFIGKRTSCTFSIIQRLRSKQETLDFETRDTVDRTEIILKIMEQMQALGYDTRNSANGSVLTTSDVLQIMERKEEVAIQFVKKQSKDAPLSHDEDGEIEDDLRRLSKKSRRGSILKNIGTSMVNEFETQEYPFSTLPTHDIPGNGSFSSSKMLKDVSLSPIAECESDWGPKEVIFGSIDSEPDRRFEGYRETLECDFVFELNGLNREDCDDLNVGGAFVEKQRRIFTKTVEIETEGERRRRKEEETCRERRNRLRARMERKQAKCNQSVECCNQSMECIPITPISPMSQSRSVHRVRSMFRDFRRKSKSFRSDCVECSSGWENECI